MKDHMRNLVAVCCLAGCVLIGRAETTAGETVPGENRPDDLVVTNNVFAGVIPKVLSNGGACKENTSSSPSVLSDGKSWVSEGGWNDTTWRNFFYTIGDRHLVQSAVIVKIAFGLQDNNWGGHIQIQTVGRSESEGALV